VGHDNQSCEKKSFFDTIFKMICSACYHAEIILGLSDFQLNDDAYGLNENLVFIPLKLARWNHNQLFLCIKARFLRR